MRTRVWPMTVVLVVIGLADGCASDSPKSGVDFANDLRARISVDALMGHLQKIQQIADAHGGTRLTGTPGYDASVDYVAKLLKDKGFAVQTPEFEVGVFRVNTESLTLNADPIAAQAVEYSGATPATGVTGPLVVIPSDDSPGCQPTDYDGVPIRGGVALVDRGTCFLAEKVAAATERGAVGLIVANDVDEKVFSGGMDEADRVMIPVISVSKTDGAALRTQTGSATMVVEARVDTTSVRNVIAQTTTGSTQNVVMVGGHIDSVRQGPGINDNGSGVSAILEAALQMGSSPPVQNAVRFALWGGEEQCVCGSLSYVKSLNVEALKDIALYLNFDMVGSPNPGYFTLDGDLSTPPDPDVDTLDIPEGSAAIERALVSYLQSVGKTAQDTPIDYRGDFYQFVLAGIPVGDLFTGAEGVKTPEQAELWGGQADIPFDPNYHSVDDTLANVSRAALEITGPGIAYAVGLYAQEQGGNFGIPARDERTRQLVE